MSDILEIYNVSRETTDKLKTYEALVLEWNKKFNLISKSSVEHIWVRHILDSVQLCQFIDDTDSVLYDLGSGAGFPAIVLAIIAEQKFPNLKVNLVESIGKKTMFLNAVKEKLGLNVEIVRDRIENLNIKNVDIITSRALASLPKLLEYANPFCKKTTKLIFPKGENLEEEITLAQKGWKFDYKTIQSLTDLTGQILYISNVRRK